MGTILWKAKSRDLVYRIPDISYTSTASFDLLIDAIINTITDTPSIQGVLSSLPLHILGTSTSEYFTPSAAASTSTLAYFSTGEVLQITESTFETQTEFEAESESLKHLLNSPLNRHPHLLTLFGVLAFQPRNISSHSNSSKYSLITISEVYPFTLSQLEQPVIESVFLNFLNATVSSLAALEQNNIPHESLKASSIYFRQDGQIKLANPLVRRTASNFTMNQTLQTLVQAPEPGYVSPLQSIHFSNPTIQLNHNAYLSDVYVLGLILLETTCASGISQFFQPTHHMRINSLIVHAGHLNFSPSTVAVLTNMLRESEDTRPNFTALLQTIKSSTTLQKMSVLCINLSKNTSKDTSLTNNNQRNNRTHTHKNPSTKPQSLCMKDNTSPPLYFMSKSNLKQENKSKESLLVTSNSILDNHYLKYDLLSSPCSPHVLTTTDQNCQTNSPTSQVDILPILTQGNVQGKHPGMSKLKRSISEIVQKMSIEAWKPVQPSQIKQNESRNYERTNRISSTSKENSTNKHQRAMNNSPSPLQTSQSTSVLRNSSSILINDKSTHLNSLTQNSSRQHLNSNHNVVTHEPSPPPPVKLRETVKSYLNRQVVAVANHKSSTSQENSQSGTKKIRWQISTKPAMLTHQSSLQNLKTNRSTSRKENTRPTITTAHSDFMVSPTFAGNQKGGMNQVSAANRIIQNHRDNIYKIHRATLSRGTMLTASKREMSPYIA